MTVYWLLFLFLFPLHDLCPLGWFPFPFRARFPNEHSPQTPPDRSRESIRLTVGLLESGAGTRTTELLGLTSSVVGDEQGTVVLDEGLLQHVLAVLVDELLVVGDEGLGDGLADSVDLGGVATAGHADADVDGGELVETDDEERLVDLMFTLVYFSPPNFLAY